MKNKLNKKPRNVKKLVIIISLCILLISGTILGICAGCGVFDSELKKASKKLSSYAMDLQVVADTNKVSVTGRQTLNYVNSTGDELNDICFHLYGRAFREDAIIRPYTTLNKASCFPAGESFGDVEMNSVTERGNAANFEFTGEDTDILKVNLSSPVRPGKKVDIFIEYKLTLANCTHRLGYYKNIINLGNFYPIVCNYSNGWQNTPYYSTGDPFVSECANYNVNITYPSNYACYGSGNVVNSSSGSTSFNALAVRDFAIILNNSAKAASTKAGNTTVTYVGYSADEDIDQNLTIAKQAVTYFNDKFGVYPYSSLVVAKSAFMQGGMEYPNFVTISDAITEPGEYQKVIVHEIAHQWWYGLVGNNQITSAWLDESLAEYSTCLFFEDHADYGNSYDDLIKDATASYLIYVDVIGSLSGKVNTSMNLPVNEYANEYEYTYMIYVKGVIMLDSLREVAGKNKLVSALKKYYSDFKYKIATEQDFISAMQKNCHKDLENFFSGWLSGSNVVGYVN